MAQKLLSLLLLLSLVTVPAIAAIYDDANCQGAWLMDVDEDPIRDSSSNSNTGALFTANNPDFTSSSKFGDGAYVFNGNDYITVTDSADFDTVLLSVAIWVSPGTLQADEYIALINKEGATAQDEWSFLLDTGATPKEVQFWVYDGDWQHADSTTTLASDSGWVHVAGTKDATHIRLYIDGVQEGGNVAQGAMQNGNANINMGAIGTDLNGRFLDGILDDTAIFDRVLDSTEINDIMDNSLSGEFSVAGGFGQVIGIRIR